MTEERLFVNLTLAITHMDRAANRLHDALTYCDEPGNYVHLRENIAWPLEDLRDKLMDEIARLKEAKE